MSSDNSTLMLIEGESVDLDADEGDTGKVVGRLFDLSNPLKFAFDDLIRLLGSVATGPADG